MCVFITFGFLSCFNFYIVLEAFKLHLNFGMFSFIVPQILRFISEHISQTYLNHIYQIRHVNIKNSVSAKKTEMKILHMLQSAPK